MIKLVKDIIKKYESKEANEMFLDGCINLCNVIPIEESDMNELVKELIQTIKGVDLSDYRKVPDIEEAKEFVKRIIPIEMVNDEHCVTFHAKTLMRWMKYLPKYEEADLMDKIEIASIPTKGYKEVIEIRVPVRFYWDEEGFDGIEIGKFKSELLPWQETMLDKCLEAVAPAMHTKEDTDDDDLE